MSLPAIAGLSSLLQTEFGAPLANHLWQSTVFAGVGWRLTVLLGKNRAQARCLVWLIASAKFLLPFSLLIRLGSHLALLRTPAVPQPRLFLAMEAIGQPFSSANLPPIPIPARAAAPSLLEAALRNLPIFLLMLWFAGCAIVLLMWFLRWRRLTAARRAALPAESGRELEALRRMERSLRSPQQIDLLLSQSALEPGILGVFRPVLVLPAGISDRLTDAQLDSVIAHELCHVCRRDNLAAALHMLVEALFWFYPLVRWIGARLVDERERACDEEVLRLGADPQVYAESILKVCKFYLESPLFCAAGVTGSNLKNRIEAIMSHHIARNLEWSKKLLLATMGVAAVVGPIMFGLLHASQSSAQAQAQNAPPIAPAFESVSVKPNTNDAPPPEFSTLGKPFSVVLFKKTDPMLPTWDHFMATNVPLRELIRVAYGVLDSHIIGGPDWVSSEKYDVDAMIGSSLIDRFSKVSKEEAGHEKARMLQALLADRFKLVLHRETRELPSYALVVAEGGPKLQLAKPGDTYADGFKNPNGRPVGPGGWARPGNFVGQGITTETFAHEVSELYLDRAVIDKTGLTGKYDFTLRWSLDRPSPVLTAIRDQLGLVLLPQNSPGEVLVIDHAEEIKGDASTQTQPQDQSLDESVAASLPPALVYDAVSIKPDKSAPTSVPTSVFPPDGFKATNVTLQDLIQWAYGVEGFQMFGAPNWLNLDRYDVEAKVDRSTSDELRNLSEQQRRAKQQPMLLELLADGFKLEVHRETRELPVFELVVAANGAKLQQTTSGESPLMRSQMRFGRGLIIGQAMPVGSTSNGRPSLVKELSFHLQRPVLDKTGLKGIYDFSLHWTPGDVQDVEHGPSFFAAIQEQLDLKLLQSNEQTAPVQMLVIDHAEEVTDNLEIVGQGVHNVDLARTFQ